MFSPEGLRPSKTPFFIFSFKGERELVTQWRLRLSLTLLYYRLPLTLFLSSISFNCSADTLPLYLSEQGVGLPTIYNAGSGSG